MNPGLRIAVADDEPDVLEHFQQSLTAMGHEVVVAASGGEELVARCAEAHPDLLITDIKMPDKDGIEAASEICQRCPLPVILVSAYHEPALIERALGGQVLAYLVKPVKRADLETAIAVAVRRFREFDALGKQAADLRQALADRKIVERAKGILMRRARIDEAAAFQRLQKLARDHNWKLVYAAETILAAEGAFQPPAADAPPEP